MFLLNEKLQNVLKGIVPFKYNNNKNNNNKLMARIYSQKNLYMKHKF